LQVGIVAPDSPVVGGGDFPRSQTGVDTVIVFPDQAGKCDPVNFIGIVPYVRHGFDQFQCTAGEVLVVHARGVCGMGADRQVQVGAGASNAGNPEGLGLVQIEDASIIGIEQIRCRVEHLDGKEGFARRHSGDQPGHGVVKRGHQDQSVRVAVCPVGNLRVDGEGRDPAHPCVEFGVRYVQAISRHPDVSEHRIHGESHVLSNLRHLTGGEVNGLVLSQQGHAGGQKQGRDKTRHQ